MIKQAVLFIAVLVNACFVYAQTGYKYKAGIASVDSSGFYILQLSPQLIAKSQYNLADIRVINSAGKQVPHLLNNNADSKERKSFIEFKEVEGARNTVTDTGTTYIVENTDNLKIGELWLQLRNTTVNRTFNIAGSDNLNQWYAIQENVALNKAEPDSNGSYEQLLQFPYCNYRYFKILLNDRNKTPVKLLRAGIYNYQLSRQAFIPLPKALFVQKDSGTISYVNIKFQDNYQLNKLQLEFAGTKYFKRRVSVYQIKGKNQQWISDHVISSAANNQEIFLNVKADKIALQFYNEDNPPLSVKTVNAYQTELSLICYLDKGVTYEVITGNSKVSTPQYDIKFFADSIRADLPHIAIAAIKQNPVFKQKAVINNQGVPAWAIWAAIVAVLILLSVLTYKMIRQVGDKSTTD